VTSAAQRRANRRNALKSTGPKSRRGRQRASLNSTTHGLSRPAEPEERRAAVDLILNALDGERMEDRARERIAEVIFEFERNVAHQREIFQSRHGAANEKHGSAEAPGVVLAPVEETEELMLISEIHGGPDEGERAWLRDAQRFMRRQHRLKGARDRREAIEALVAADRYFRRSANQLIKVLKNK
jgi:hypothetical protein